jgi:hypothetical protein
VIQRAQEDPASLTPADVLTLQRSIGNQSTVRLLAPTLQPKLKLGPAGDPYEQEADRVAQQVVQQTDSSSRTAQRAAQSDEEEIQASPLTATISRVQRQPKTRPLARMFSPEIQRQASSVQRAEGFIQRRIEPIAGKSSGWFRQGRRDKLNAKVAVYNQMENRFAGTNRNVQSFQLLVAKAEEILRDANAWRQAVARSKPEKAQEILTWIETKVQPELEMKRAALNDLQQAVAMKDAWDNPTYNPLYTTDEYTKAGNAGIRWLSTPDLAPVYKYHIIKNQFEGITLNAYEDIVRYKQNPSRAEALRVYDKYRMGTADDLNITGEGAGGIESINKFREKIEALRRNDNGAVVPAGFGAIETSIVNVLNEIFISFRLTEPYKTITTPPG